MRTLLKIEMLAIALRKGRGRAAAVARKETSKRTWERKKKKRDCDDCYDFFYHREVALAATAAKAMDRTRCGTENDGSDDSDSESDVGDDDDSAKPTKTSVREDAPENPDAALAVAFAELQRTCKSKRSSKRK